MQNYPKFSISRYTFFYSLLYFLEILTEMDGEPEQPPAETETTPKEEPAEPVETKVKVEEDEVPAPNPPSVEVVKG